MEEGSYECEMMLPPTADFQTITGPLCKTAHLSKQLVCLEGCKMLHEMGALTDHLILNNQHPSINTKGPSSGAGTHYNRNIMFFNQVF